MSKDAIDRILRERQGSAPDTGEEEKFYSTVAAEGLSENFLELRFRNGLQTGFSYADLVWYSHDPDAGTVDIEFGGFLVTITGRGLGERFLHSLRMKRIGWIREAESDFQDHDGIEVFIREIAITPPEDFSEEQGDAG